MFDNMKGFGHLLTVFAIVSLESYNTCHAQKVVEDARLNKTFRIKRGFSWDFVDTFDNSDARLTRRQPRSSTPPSEDPNPCNRILPPMPDFNVPGRRISEVKCEEIKWNLTRLAEKNKKNEECKEYTRKVIKKLNYRPLVAGGRITKPGEFPHMGALGWRAVVGDWIFQCGCVLISSKFLLTAAHCSVASSRDTSIASSIPEIVRLRVTNIKKWPLGISPYDGEIRQIIVHPRYASPKKYYDIAVVELKYELTFVDDYIVPACLWTQYDTTPLGRRAFATGWGYTDEADREMTAELQAAVLDIIDTTQCEVLLKLTRIRHFTDLQDHQMCAGVLEGGVDTCRGDSGGPLQVKIPTTERLSYIIGITSFGYGCARAYSPGVYTRISSFIDWIEGIVWRQ